MNGTVRDFVIVGCRLPEMLILNSSLPSQTNPFAKNCMFCCSMMDDIRLYLTRYAQLSHAALCCAAVSHSQFVNLSVCKQG